MSYIVEEPVLVRCFFRDHVEDIQLTVDVYEGCIEGENILKSLIDKKNADIIMYDDLVVRMDNSYVYRETDSQD